MSPFLSGLLWALVLLSFFCSFVFSALKAAFTHANWSRIRGIAAIDKKSKKVSKLNDDRQKAMAVILIGDTLADVVIAAAFTALLSQYLSPGWGLVLSILVAFILLLLLAEILPKKVGQKRPEALLNTYHGFLKGAMVFFAPLVWLVMVVEKQFDAWIPAEKASPEIEEELITIVSEAQSEGGMDEEEGELILSAIEFRDLDAQDILTPRVDIVGVSHDATMEETLNVFIENEFTRLPVYEESMDKIIGILHQKDFFIGYFGGEKEMLSIIKPALFAPNTIKTSKLLSLLQENKSHMAIIVDEFGGTEGIATMEDLLEELVGEIYDEHDDMEAEIEVDGEGNYLVDGSIDLDDILEKFNLEDIYESDTVAGWAAEVMGKIPVQGDSFEVKGIKVIVTQAERKRANQVKIVVTAPLTIVDEDE